MIYILNNREFYCIPKSSHIIQHFYLLDQKKPPQLRSGNFRYENEKNY